MDDSEPDDLTVKEILETYFRVEDLQKVLKSFHLPFFGRKTELFERVLSLINHRQYELEFTKIAKRKIVDIYRKRISTQLEPLMARKSKTKSFGKRMSGNKRGSKRYEDDSSYEESPEPSPQSSVGSLNRSNHSDKSDVLMSHSSDESDLNGFIVSDSSPLRDDHKSRKRVITQSDSSDHISDGNRIERSIKSKSRKTKTSSKSVNNVKNNKKSETLKRNRVYLSSDTSGSDLDIRRNRRTRIRKNPIVDSSSDSDDEEDIGSNSNHMNSISDDEIMFIEEIPFSRSNLKHLFTGNATEKCDKKDKVREYSSDTESSIASEDLNFSDEIEDIVEKTIEVNASDPPLVIDNHDIRSSITTVNSVSDISLNQTSSLTNTTHSRAKSPNVDPRLARRQMQNDSQKSTSINSCTQLTNKTVENSTISSQSNAMPLRPVITEAQTSIPVTNPSLNRTEHSYSSQVRTIPSLISDTLITSSTSTSILTPIPTPQLITSKFIPQKVLNNMQMAAKPVSETPKKAVIKVLPQLPVMIHSYRLTFDLRHVIPKPKSVTKKNKNIPIDVNDRLPPFFHVQVSEPSRTISIIKNKLNFNIIDSSDIEALDQSLKVSIICPITNKRVKTPSRSVHCRHIDCFDLEAFIQINRFKYPSEWRCPQCKQPARVSPTVDLIIDGLVKHILEATDSSCEAVIFDNKAIWSPDMKKADNAINKTKDSTVDDIIQLDADEDEPDLAQKTTTTQSATNQIEKAKTYYVRTVSNLNQTDKSKFLSTADTKKNKTNQMKSRSKSKRREKKLSTKSKSEPQYSGSSNSGHRKQYSNGPDFSYGSRQRPKSSHKNI